MSTISRRGLLSAIPAIALSATVLDACGSSSGSSTSDPLTIMADATPQTDILKKAVDLGLLGDYKLDIKSISGDIDVNQLTESGDVKANYFQHKPYLDFWQSDKGVSDLVSVASVHIEPMGLYSKKVTSVSATPSGATIAVPSDVSNYVRALFLLQEAKLITLNVKATDKNLDFSKVSAKNITANPKNIKFLQIDRPQLAASLSDAKVTLSVINGNYALEGGLKPTKDALAIESKTLSSRYANLIVVKSDLKDDPRVKKLAEAVTSTQIQDWIQSNYSGAVIPAGA